LSCGNSLYSLSKSLLLHLECLATSSGSLGLLNSTKKVIHFCNLVEARRLPKCTNQGGSSITLASPLVSILVLGYFGFIFILLPDCILVSLLLNLALVKLEYIISKQKQLASCHFKYFRRKRFQGPLRGQLNEMWKVIRVIMRPMRKRFPLMKRKSLMGLKTLSKVFSRKEEKFFVHVLCFSYERNVNEISSRAK